MVVRAKMARLAGRVVILALGIALFACSGATRTSLALSTGTPFAGLPALPLDVPGHSVSSTQNSHIDGISTFARSIGAIDQGSNLLLFTTQTNPPTLEWGLYRYVPDTVASEVVQSATIGFSVNPGTNGWVGIANYATGMWEFRGPYNTGGGPSLDFTGLDLGGYLSPGGNLYFITAAYNGTTATVGGIDITSDVTAPATFTISGKAIDNSTSNGIPNVTINLDGGAQTTTTDGSGNYSFSGMSNGLYSLAAVTVAGYNPFSPISINASVLNADSTGNDFSADPTGPAGVTYETGLGEIKALIDDRCVYCHSPTGPGGPQTPYLRDWSEVSANLSLIDLYVLTFQTMPKVPKTLSIAERQKFQDWKDNNHAQ